MNGENWKHERAGVAREKHSPYIWLKSKNISCKNDSAIVTNFHGKMTRELKYFMKNVTSLSSGHETFEI